MYVGWYIDNPCVAVEALAMASSSRHLPVANWVAGKPRNHTSAKAVPGFPAIRARLALSAQTEGSIWNDSTRETLHDGEVYEGEQHVATVRYWIKETRSGHFPGPSVPKTLLRVSGLPNGLEMGIR